MSTTAQDSHNKMENNQLRMARWLVRAKASGGFRSVHFWIILTLFAALTYVYYTFLIDFYDIYLVIFFYPLIYAAITFRMRGVLIGSAVILGILLPHAILLVSDTHSLLRLLLFGLFAFLISGLGATLLNFIERQLATNQQVISLNQELNHYIERLETTHKQLIQAEKLNAIGQLAASVAHEINNPLAGVLVYAKLMLKKLDRGDLNQAEEVENLNKIKNAVGHCSKITRSLLDFSRQSEPELKHVSLESIVQEVMTLTGHQAQINNIEVSVGDMSSLPEIIADPGQLKQVFVNLIMNAIQAMPEGGRLSIDGLVDGDNWLKVSIKDTGTGITAKNMEKLFMPFFTTKEPGKGTGLGLAVSFRIMEKHSGKIEVQSKAGKGSTFTVCLPPNVEEGTGASTEQPIPSEKQT